MSDNNNEQSPKRANGLNVKEGPWRRKSRDGSQTYLSGHIVTVDEFGMEKRQKVVMFSNKDKDPNSERYNEKAPDYKMYLSKDPAEESQSNAETTDNSRVEVVENEEVL